MNIRLIGGKSRQVSQRNRLIESRYCETPGTAMHEGMDFHPSSEHTQAIPELHPRMEVAPLLPPAKVPLVATINPHRVRRKWWWPSGWLTKRRWHRPHRPSCRAGYWRHWPGRPPRWALRCRLFSIAAGARTKVTHYRGI